MVASSHLNPRRSVGVLIYVQDPVGWYATPSCVQPMQASNSSECTVQYCTEGCAVRSAGEMLALHWSRGANSISPAVRRMQRTIVQMVCVTDYVQTVPLGSTEDSSAAPKRVAVSVVRDIAARPSNGATGNYSTVQSTGTARVWFCVR